MTNLTPTPPTGTLTFLFTDIEGSTTRWEHHPSAMKPAVDRHDTILHSAIEANGGRVFKRVGDALCAVFPTAPQALAAGKPVIAYDFDGADEVCLDRETGFLIRTGDVASVTRHLLELAGDPLLRNRLGDRGQQLVKDQFPVEKMIDQIYQLYHRLLATDPT